MAGGRHLADDGVVLDDVTWVEGAGNRIVAIGKGLAQDDCYDTGVFAIGPALFAALRTLDAPPLTDRRGILPRTGDAPITDCAAVKLHAGEDPLYLAKREACPAARAAAVALTSVDALAAA